MHDGGICAPGLQLLTYFAPCSSFSFASNIWNGMAPPTSSPSTPLPTLLPTMNVGVPLAPIFMASSTSVCTGSLYLPLAIQGRKAPGSTFREAAKPTMCSISSEFGLAPMVSRSSQNLPCSPAQRAAMAARMALGWKSSGMSLLKKRTFPVSRKGVGVEIERHVLAEEAHLPGIEVGLLQLGKSRHMEALAERALIVRVLHDGEGRALGA